MNPLIDSNITQPDKYGYQTRVWSREKEYSRYFSFKQWGNKAKALNAAQSWRDQLKVIFKVGSKRRLQPQQNNTSGVTGVRYDESFSEAKQRIQFSYTAHWTDHKGKGHNKTFYIGNENTWTKRKQNKAFEAACRFRTAWEEASDKNKLETFDSTEYNGWQ